MKTEFKFVSASIVGIVCASLMSSSFAASSVRSLGGAGTYSGTTSAAKAATANSAVTAARAGSIRVDSSTRVNNDASLRAPSTRSATAPRLSIGKYLAGSSALGSGSKVDVDLSSNDKFTNLQGNVEDLTLDIEQLQQDLHNINTDFDVSYADGVLTIAHGNEAPVEIPIFNPTEAEEKINEMINSAIEANGSGSYSAGDMIEFETDDEGKTSVSAKIVGALSGSLTEDGLVTANQVVEYAIPKPQDACNYTTCVLSYQNGEPYWLELVDDDVVAGNTETTDSGETETTDSGEADGI